MKYLLLLLLALSACSKPAQVAHRPSVQVPVHLDPAFNQDETKQIQQAINEWNYSLNQQEVLVIQEPLDPSKDYDGFQLQIQKGDGELTPDGVLGWTNELNDPHITLLTNRTDPNFSVKVLTMHEIGHALGLEHILVKGSLMFPYIQFQPDCVDEVSARQLASVHSWLDIHQMHYCKLPE